MDTFTFKITGTEDQLEWLVSAMGAAADGRSLTEEERDILFLAAKKLRRKDVVDLR